MCVCLIASEPDSPEGVRQEGEPGTHSDTFLIHCLFWL